MSDQPKRGAGRRGLSPTVLNENLYGLSPTLLSDSVPDSQDERWPAQAPPWLCKRMDRLKKSTEYVRALKKITDRAKVWYMEFSRERNMPDFFAYLVCAAVTRKRGKRKVWESMWTHQTGKTWRALEEFPARIIKMADEVEQLNKSHFFAPTSYINARTGEAESVRRRFGQLPGIMHLYADCLRQHIARLPRLTSEVYPSSPQGHPIETASLSLFVKCFTGAYLDREVADLLNAASRALGEASESDTEDRFNEFIIAKLRSRRMKSLRQWGGRKMT
jgi:hypothetical protein